MFCSIPAIATNIGFSAKSPPVTVPSMTTLGTRSINLLIVCHTLSVQPTVKISSTCGASLTAIEGIVTSPAYPNYYGDLLDCKWTIRGAIGQKIAMKIVDLHLEDAM